MKTTKIIAKLVQNAVYRATLLQEMSAAEAIIAKYDTGEGVEDYPEFKIAQDYLDFAYSVLNGQSDDETFRHMEQNGKQGAYV